MLRSILPQDYLLNQGIILSDFENIADFTIVGGIGEENTSQYRTGTTSLKLTAITDAGAPNATKIIDLNLANTQLFSFWVYLHSSEDTDWQVTLDFSSTIDFSKRMRATFEGNKWLYQNQWCKLSCHRDDFVSLSGDLWSNRMVRFKITAFSHGGKRISASFDDLRCGEEGIPRCVITFDDGHITNIGGGKSPYDYMVDKGLRGTLYIIPIVIGTAGHISLSQLQSLYGQGWAIANHTETHGRWASNAITSQSEFEDEIAGCKDYLINNDMPRAALHLAYPGGYPRQPYSSLSVIQVSRAAMVSQGMLTGRTVVGYCQPTPMGNYHYLNSRMVSPTTSLATATNWVDQAIKQQSTLVIGLHDITDGAGTDNRWSITNYKALIDYIVARRIRCLTIDEWYKGLTDSRYRSLLLIRA